jgi:hypothetical protein
VLELLGELAHARLEVLVLVAQRLDRVHAGVVVEEQHVVALQHQDLFHLHLRTLEPDQQIVETAASLLQASFAPRAHARAHELVELVRPVGEQHRTALAQVIDVSTGRTHALRTVVDATLQIPVEAGDLILSGVLQAVQQPEGRTALGLARLLCLERPAHVQREVALGLGAGQRERRGEASD